ncbi:MAG: 4-(cytidine 5'-diphospho)-2-C-methyl-D-erythritol kinase, partial [Methylovirgula sp.]
MSHPLTERAPAKINLTLHVLGRRADGYHELESLVAFSRSGDVLTLLPGDEFKFEIDGPMAAAAGDPPQNLVVKAVRHLAERVSGLKLGTLHLKKELPVAAGIGGGSSDAAAALRLVVRANGIAPDDPRLTDAAQATGADVPVCLATQARTMT